MICFKHIKITDGQRCSLDNGMQNPQNHLTRTIIQIKLGLAWLGLRRYLSYLILTSIAIVCSSCVGGLFVIGVSAASTNELGDNLINLEKANKRLYYSPGNEAIVDSEIVAYGISDLVPVVPGETYTLSGNNGKYSGGFFGEDADIREGQKAISSISDFYTPVSGDGKYFIVPQDESIKYVALNLVKDVETDEFLPAIKLEIGEMATDFKPYSTNTRAEKDTQIKSGVQYENRISQLPRPSYAFEKSKIERFRSHMIKKDKDIVVVGTGTSLTARSSEHCTTRNDEKSRPPLLHSNNFASRIWDRIKWEGQQYRRFDYPGFFVERGSFQSSSNLQEWDDASYRYGITRYASDLASVEFTIPEGAWQFNFIYRTDTTGSQAVTLHVAEGDGMLEVYDGKKWTEANNYEFSMRESVVDLQNVNVYNPNTVGNTTVYFDTYQIGGNTTYQKRLKMRCKSEVIDSRDSSKTVLLSSFKGRLMYWGVEWSPREYMITYINASRGSHNMSYNSDLSLLHYQENEIWSFSPDLIFTENPIHNSGGGGSEFGSFYSGYWGQITYDFFFNEENPVSLTARATANGIIDLEWIIFTSSVTWNFGGIDDDGDLIVSEDKDGRMITCLDAMSMTDQWINENEDKVISINACKYWCDAAIQLFGDLKTATVGSGRDGATFTNEGSHWNDTGSEVMDRCIGPVFDFYN